LEQKYQDLELKSEKEILTLNTKMDSLRESVQGDKKPMKADLEKYKALSERYESEKSDLMQLYER
jgi:hypothetical protein